MFGVVKNTINKELFIKFIEEERIVVLNLQKALTNHYITDIQIFYTNNNKKKSFWRQYTDIEKKSLFLFRI